MEVCTLNFWESTGMSYPKLVNRLLQLAIERHRDDSKIITLKLLYHQSGVLLSSDQNVPE